MSLNILIVDDSSVMRSIIARSLVKGGVDVGELHQASNGFEALELLSKKEVDLAFFDINMELMSGEQLLAQVRENPRTAQLPVVIVSTEGSTTRIERLQQQGAAFVRKPFTPDRLCETVNAKMKITHD